jgi:hypothetical protein
MGDSSRDVGKSPLHLQQNTAAGNFVPECNCLGPQYRAASFLTFADGVSMPEIGCLTGGRDADGACCPVPLRIVFFIADDARLRRSEMAQS